MKSRVAPILWLTLALLCGSVFAEENIRWAPDIVSARRASAEFKVPLLIHFYGDNCLPCKTLEQRVLSQADVISTLNKFFICVKVNASQDRQTAAEFQVHSWPTDVFVSPDGKTLYQGVCVQDVRGYSSILENVKVMNRDRNVMLAAGKPTQPIGSITQQVAPIGGSNFTPNLPPPGASVAAGSLTPGFYASATNGTAASGPQSLPPSMAPTQSVQSGPLLASAQPSAIGGSTPAIKQQLQRPTAPVLGSSPSGQLPDAAVPQNLLASPVDSRSENYRNGSLPFTPTTNQLVQSATVTPAPMHQFASANRLNADVANAGQSMSNPYYPSASISALATNGMVAASLAGVPSEMENRVAAQPVTFQPRTSTAASPVVAESRPADVSPAIDGYCPVALRREGKWIAGDPRYAVRHRGRVYWLSSQQAQAQFLQSPDEQSPVLSGYDPMLFLNEGRLVEGSVQWGLLEEVSGAFLFFTTEELKLEYEKNFDTNTRALAVIMQQAGVK